MVDGLRSMVVKKLFLFSHPSSLTKEHQQSGNTLKRTKYYANRERASERFRREKQDRGVFHAMESMRQAAGGRRVAGDKGEGFIL